MSTTTSWIFTITTVIDAGTVEEAAEGMAAWFASDQQIAMEYENDDTGESGTLMLREHTDGLYADEYCHDERHDEPCPLPCRACEEECVEGPTFTYWEEVTLGWEARLDENGNVVKVAPDDPDMDIHDSGIGIDGIGRPDGLDPEWEVVN